MGNNLGRSFACLFVSYQAEKIFQSYQGPIPELFKHFVDDGIGATSMPRSDLEKFISFVCNFHPALQFEYQISNSYLSSLDIKLQITDNHITTSIFYKETDSHSYLHNDSSHNPKCITSIPFSELLRLRRLCSDDEDFKTKANEMSTFFSNCNYSPNTIQSAINRISKISQAEALQPRPKQSTTKRTPLVLTYHAHMHRIKRIFLRNFKKILQHEKSDTKHIFTSPPLLAYRRDTNLKQPLVRSSLNPKPNGTHPCGHSLCRTCEHTNPSDAISGPKNTFHIQHHFTCSSVCVIYSITCTKCSTLYIGETCRQLNTRFGEHLRSVEEKKHLSPEHQNDDDINVAIHFNLPNHSIDDMIISALLYAPAKKLPRKTLEKKIIFKLGTITPSGLNKQFSFLF